jgi:hypothetical protein
MITELQPNQVIVVGTNLEGKHGAGAAAQANKDFGLAWGIGVGLSGQAYGIPTMDGYDRMVRYINQFIDFAAHYPSLEFLVTPIGTGIAGYTKEDTAPLFTALPSNIILPEEWR